MTRMRIIRSQFKRFYNIYFLCAAIFVCAEPSLSPVTEILPLTLVLTITAIKDALEDYVRRVFFFFN